MTFINRTVDNLNSFRRSEITNLLKGIANRGDKVVINQKSIRGDFIIGASDSTETGVDYKDWRFRTYVQDYSAGYFERWIPIENDLYFLDRAYFHIYTIDKDRVIEKEFICLHCDPNEPDSSEHAKYKKSPHLHISCSPIAHSHIALNNGNLDEILTSIESLDIALKHAIEMIDHQILIPLTAS